MVAAVRRLKMSIPLLIVLLLAGCGSSATSSSGTTAGPATTGSTKSSSSPNDRAAFIGKADALCKSANARQEALRRRATGLAVTKLVPILRQQAVIAGTLATDLGKLAPPTGERVTVGRFVTAVRQLSVYSRAVANSIAANHAFASRALAAKLSTTRAQEKLLGQGYGYKICASGRSY